MKNLFFIVLLAFTVHVTGAQIRTPNASPISKVEQSVGLGTITIEYNRPSVKGRKVFGDLVPFGQLWRTAANQGTKITFSDDVKIAGKDIKKGKYSIFTIPGETEWSIILHTDANLNVPGGDGYKQSDEALRFTVKPTKMSALKETFTVEFDQINDNGAEIFIAWENTRVGFMVDVVTDPKVMASIKAVMDGPASGDYMAAANYYASSGKDINKAVEWSTKAVAMGADQFFFLRQYSLILAKAGKYKEAVDAATKSLAKSKEAKNADYIKMNEASIKEWGMKK